jgi:DNA-nicking Smr family endonuclease
MSEEKSSHPKEPRRLTTEEEHLWSTVARSIKPLRAYRKTVLRALHKVAHKPAIADVARPTRPLKIAAKTTPNPVTSIRAAAPAPQAVIARREKQQLARGRAPIDARIDLHGMTQAEAHDALRLFLYRAQAKGAKFVLVITGKGSPDLQRGERGILRRQVPLWLGLPEFRACVLGFDIAHGTHGGEGALYIRLRKARG